MIISIYLSTVHNAKATCVCVSVLVCARSQFNWIVAALVENGIEVWIASRMRCALCIWPEHVRVRLFCHVHISCYYTSRCCFYTFSDLSFLIDTVSKSIKLLKLSECRNRSTQNDE